MKSYKVFASLHSETRTGDVWNYEKLDSRLIKIINVANNKSIIVVNRRIESNFENLYNEGGKLRILLKYDPKQTPIIIDEYYRRILEIKKTQELFNLTIVVLKNIQLLTRLKYLAQHPNESVKISFWLAIFSIILSFLSIAELIYKYGYKLLILLCKHW